MIPLYSESTFLKAKSVDKLPCECIVCHSEFLKEKRYITRLRKTQTNGCFFCSRKCKGLHERKKQVKQCETCGKTFEKRLPDIKKTAHNFCSQSCSAIYRNTHKTHGTRRSKLEVWLEQQLAALYPSLELHFNRKDAINAELDIYIPSLKLAFELNGLFHYEPIFGADKLAQIQNNDQRKYQACIEHDIELCLIDVSSIKYFKPQSVQKYLEIITCLIDKKLVEPKGLEPSPFSQPARRSAS